MKGRSCWEPRAIRSLCNSGCLSKINRGQYGDSSGVVSKDAALELSQSSSCVWRQVSSWCLFLSHIEICHSSIQLLVNRGCWHFCSILEQCTGSLCEKRNLSPLFHFALHALSCLSSCLSQLMLISAHFLPAFHSTLHLRMDEQECGRPMCCVCSVHRCVLVPRGDSLCNQKL